MAAIGVHTQTAPIISAQLQKVPLLWNKASKNLGDKDRRTLQLDAYDNYDPLDNTSSTCHDILAAVEKAIARVSAEKQPKTIRLGKAKLNFCDVAGRVRHWVMKFVTVGDIAVQFDPAHAVLPWAAFRFLLIICVSASSDTDTIMLGLQTIAQIVARCHLYEALYLCRRLPSEDALTTGLTELYTVILHFLATTKRRCEKSKWERAGGAIFDVTKKKELLEAIKLRSEEVDKIASHMSAEGSITSLDTISRKQESDSARILELQNLVKSLENPINRTDIYVSMIYDLLQEENTRILNWISKIEYEKHFKTAANDIAIGTCKWLTVRSSFQDWRKSDQSSVFWLLGDPGTGKTKLTSFVIQNLHDQLGQPKSTERFKLAYFICSRNEQERRTPENIFASLTRQLAFDGSYLRQGVVSDYRKEKVKGFPSGSLELKRSIEHLRSFTSKSNTYIVIDALDECDRSSRADIVTMLKYLMESSQGRIKIFISSRYEPDIERLLKGVQHHKISSQDNQCDIDAYIDTKLHQSIEKGDILDGQEISHELQETIAGKLKEKANGMFLWVDLQIKGLYQWSTVTELRRSIDSLPDGLDATYDAIFDKILGEKGVGKCIAISTLQWTMGAVNPLPRVALTEAVRATCEIMYPETRQFFSDGDEIAISVILSKCHNLVALDAEMDVVRFTHLSVREYLESSERAPVSERHSHIAITRSCVPALISPSSSASFNYLKYIRESWGYHAGQARSEEDHDRTDETILHDLASFMWCGRNTSDAFLDWLRWTEKNEVRDQSGRSGWQELSGKCPRQSAIMKRHFEKAICPLAAICFFGLFELLDEKYCGEAKLDFCSSFSKTEVGGRLLLGAIQYSNHVLTKDLLRRGAHIDLDHRISLLHNCIQDRHWDMVEALLWKDFQGKEVVLRDILKPPARDNNIELMVDLVRRAAIDADLALGTVAACKGSVEMVRALIEAGADVNAPPSKAFSYHRPPLALAVEAGADLAVIRELLVQGAEVDELMLSSARSCRKRRVQQLLEHSLDIQDELNWCKVDPPMWLGMEPPELVEKPIPDIFT